MSVRPRKIGPCGCGRLVAHSPTSRRARGTRRRVRWVLPLLVAALALVMGPVFATTYVELTIEEIIAAAEVGFHGEVVDVAVEERDGLPWTVVTFRIERDLVGAVPPADGGEPTPLEPGTTIELEFLGGTLPGGPSLAVALMPAFTAGEQVVVLAYPDAGSASPIVGFRQGLWRVEDEILADEDDVPLGLDDGALARGGPAAPLGAVLDALSTALEGRP